MEGSSPLGGPPNMVAGITPTNGKVGLVFVVLEEYPHYPASGWRHSRQPFAPKLRKSKRRFLQALV